ncbi:MAG TPA: hypothetical protein VFQ85_07205 [Mycobacteriales bacterium]|nr:hypothetical protein [Mycobacteriales bacterium]
MAGDAFVRPGHPADLRVVHERSTGYDGQFVYRLALDPFTRSITDDGITLDNAPYRQQRVGLPFAAWAVRGATGLPLPVVLLLVNAAALVAATAAGAVLARRAGRNALWGLLAGLSPGLVVAVTRDLTEPLAAALLLAGLVAWTGRRPAVAAAAFTAAVLTRETALAMLAGLGLHELFRLARGSDRAAAARRALLLLVPLAVDAAWQAHLRAVWGELPLHATDGDVGLPLARTVTGLLAHDASWRDWTSTPALLAHAAVGERLLLAALLAATAVALARSAGDPRLRWAWVPAALLATSAAWATDVGFLRAANEAVLAGTLVLFGLRTRLGSAALTATAGLSLYVAAVYGAAL